MLEMKVFDQIFLYFFIVSVRCSGIIEDFEADCTITDKIKKIVRRRRLSSSKPFGDDLEVNLFGTEEDRDLNDKHSKTDSSNTDYEPIVSNPLTSKGESIKKKKNWKRNPNSYTDSSNTGYECNLIKKKLTTSLKADPHTLGTDYDPRKSKYESNKQKNKFKINPKPDTDTSDVDHEPTVSKPTDSIDVSTKRRTSSIETQNQIPTQHTLILLNQKYRIPKMQATKRRRS